MRETCAEKLLPAEGNEGKYFWKAKLRSRIYSLDQLPKKKKNRKTTQLRIKNRQRLDTRSKKSSSVRGEFAKTITHNCDFWVLIQKKNWAKPKTYLAHDLFHAHGLSLGLAVLREGSRCHSGGWQRRLRSPAVLFSNLLFGHMGRK